MSIDLDRLLLNDEADRIGVASLSPAQREALAQWGMRMYGLGQHTVADIEEVKYDGRLIILDDGTRWEVNSTDSSTAEMWSVGDKVVVINDEMYKLDEFEMVNVEQEV
jgi:hypothetical protein